MKAASIIFPAVLCAGCYAQSQQGAEVFSRGQVQGQIALLSQEARTSGSSGSTLGDYGTHAIKISERTVSGGAEIHAHFDDIMFVTGGTATLITGGEVMDARLGNNGETTGSGIHNGQSHSIAEGDVIHIPAGTPHQVLVKAGSLYTAIVIKVKE